MEKRGFIVGCLFLLLGALFVEAVNSDDLSFARNETRGMLAEGLKAIQSAATPAEKAIIDQIKIEVDRDGHPSLVGAYIDGSGRRVIVVSASFSALVRMVSAGYYLEHFANKRNFGDYYAKYAAETYTTASLDGGQPPWDKAGLSGSERDSLLQSKEFNSTIHGQHLVSLWHVLAHEIAHHLFKHTDSANKTADLDKLRFREEMADMWAADMLIKLGFPPALSFPAFMYYHYLDPLNVKHEIRRTHPSDLKRFRSTLNISLAKYDEWNSNSKYFPEIPKEKGFPALRKLLFHIEDIIYQQTVFSDSLLSSKEFQNCINSRHEGCMKECIYKYRNPSELCESKYCSSENSKRSWKLGCKETVMGREDRKKFEEFLVEHVRNSPKL